MKFIDRSGPARCHPDRPEHARKLCFECYTKTWHPRDPYAPKCVIHPDQPVYTRGLCWNCLQAEWHCQRGGTS